MEQVVSLRVPPESMGEIRVMVWRTEGNAVKAASAPITESWAQFVPRTLHLTMPDHALETMRR